LGPQAVRTVIVEATFIAPVLVNALLCIHAFFFSLASPRFQTAGSVSSATALHFTRELQFPFPLAIGFLLVFRFLPDIKPAEVKEALSKKLRRFTIPRGTPVFKRMVATTLLPDDNHVPERQDLKVEKVLKRLVSIGIVKRMGQAGRF
jgi:hypothetical protein